MQQQYAAENTTVVADIADSGICDGLDPSAAVMSGVLLHVLLDNSRHYVAISPCTGQQR